MALQNAAQTAPAEPLIPAPDASGTPGALLMRQSPDQSAALENNAIPYTAPQAAAQPLPQAETVTTAPIGAAGTPIEYDYSRNLVPTDAGVMPARLPESVRTLQSAGQNYTVMQGDTVYSLSRQHVSA